MVRRCPKCNNPLFNDEIVCDYCGEAIAKKERIPMETIKIKKLYDYAKIPTRGSEYAAGYDLYACIDAKDTTDPTITIAPHEIYVQSDV